MTHRSAATTRAVSEQNNHCWKCNVPDGVPECLPPDDVLWNDLPDDLLGHGLPLNLRQKVSEALKYDSGPSCRMESDVEG